MPGARGAHQGIEVDINDDSSTSGPSGKALTLGVNITGVGLTNPSAALVVDRYDAGTSNWEKALDLKRFINGIVMTGVGRSSGDGVLMYRLTDSGPTGQFFRCVNEANTENIFLVDVNGNLTTVGGVEATVNGESGANNFTATNRSNANTTAKFINFRFRGVDTVNATKDAGGFRIDPIDANWVDGQATLNVRRNDSLRPALTLYGNGSPESVITAPVGSLYTNRNGGTGATLYVKESGTGNTGWVAK
jgi:hypothetical protein